MTKRITVFGGSVPRPGETAYQQALELGAMIGRGGFTVLTGGYSGTMEAVSRGAYENGGHVIGVTCDELESWRPLPPNRWLHEELRCPTLRERMYALIDHCDIAMALPGGIGTLAEIGAMWSSLQTSGRSTPPLIVIGEGWKQTLGVMRATLRPYVRDAHWDLIEFAPDVRAAYSRAHDRLNGRD